MRHQVFFTLYADPAMHQTSFEEALARAVTEFCPTVGKELPKAHNIIRIEIEDDGDGLEIKAAEFVTAESLAAEKRSQDQLLATMRDELLGDGT